MNNIFTEDVSIRWARSQSFALLLRRSFPTCAPWQFVEMEARGRSSIPGRPWQRPAPAEGWPRPALGARRRTTDISSQSAGWQGRSSTAGSYLSLWEAASASRWTGAARHNRVGGRWRAGPLDGVPWNGLVLTAIHATRHREQKPQSDRHR